MPHRVQPLKAVVMALGALCFASCVFGGDSETGDGGDAKQTVNVNPNVEIPQPK